jgi:hypothetical protein
MTTAWTTRTCTNMFLEEDGFCSQCGKNHFFANVSAKKPQATSQASAIEQNIESNPNYRECRNLIRQMAADYGIQVEVIFRNRSGSCHTMRNGKHTIILGYESVTRSAEKGFKEYASLEYLVWNRKNTGLDGVRLLAIHEFGHVVDTQENGRAYGVAHGSTYAKCYKALLSLYA